MQKKKKSFRMGHFLEHTKVGTWPIISLTILRMAIGWHFLFEGLLKVINPNWTAAIFLSNATGPFAGLFQGIVRNQSLLGISDFFNKWGLTAVGLSLMIGLFSRWACIGGMLLLGLYYLASPPFIGLGNAALSEGNYLIVNKNLIEFLALWVLFLFNDSKAFGIDRFFNRTP